MANNDYWAYLRNENELKHYRTKGSKNGVSTDPNYTPIGQKAKGILDAAGNYIYNTGNKIGNAVSTAAQNIRTNLNANPAYAAVKKRIGGDVANLKRSIGNATSGTIGEIRRRINAKKTAAQNKIIEATRTSYGDMKSNPKAAKAARAKELDRQYGNYLYNKNKDLSPDGFSPASDRPQDAMKKGQQERRDYIKKGLQDLIDIDNRTYSDQVQGDMQRRKDEALKKKYAGDVSIQREYQKYLQQKAEEEKRKAQAAANKAKLDKWGYKD